MSGVPNRHKNTSKKEIKVKISQENSQVEQDSTTMQKSLAAPSQNSSSDNKNLASSKSSINIRSRKNFTTRKSVNASNQTEVVDGDEVRRLPTRKNVEKATSGGHELVKKTKEVPNRVVTRSKSAKYPKKDASTQFPEIITLDEAQSTVKSVEEPSTSNNSTLDISKVKANNARKYSMMLTRSKGNKNNPQSSKGEMKAESELTKTNKAESKSKNNKSKTGISGDKHNVALKENDAKHRTHAGNSSGKGGEATSSLFDSPTIAAVKRETHTPQSPIASISKHNVWAVGSPNTSKNNLTPTKNLPKQSKPSIEGPGKNLPSNLLNTNDGKKGGKLMTTRSNEDDGCYSKNKIVDSREKAEGKNQEEKKEKSKEKEKSSEPSKRFERKQKKLAENFGKFAECVADAVATVPNATNAECGVVFMQNPNDSRPLFEQALDLLENSTDSEHSTDCGCSSCAWTSDDHSNSHSSDCTCSSCLHSDDSSDSSSSSD